CWPIRFCQQTSRTILEVPDPSRPSYRANVVFGEAPAACLNERPSPAVHYLHSTPTPGTRI
ncbi:hypothetical protein FRC08_014874, partial [Ceratobasidium sp. 394]